jgi:anthranilate phosphoribosyltransferase
MIREAIGAVVEGESLSVDAAAQAMSEIMSGEATPAQFGALVTALRLKGETAGEIAGMARVMRERSLHVQVDGPLVDTCGTGGDRSNSFNVSTTAALVAAGAGARVAKHGNRAMSGACGSADVLEAVGAKIDLSPEAVERCLEEVGFGFMFAPRYHPSMKFAAALRREIGIRTVFNILGPLTNPAGAKAQLVGAADPVLAEKMADVLAQLGSERALVVSGVDGLDEITVSDETQVWELRDGGVSTYRISPEQLGIERSARERLRVADANEAADVLRGVLGGTKGPARDVVLLNAGAALAAAGRVPSIAGGIEAAAESIDSGSARGKLRDFVRLSQELE